MHSFNVNHCSVPVMTSKYNVFYGHFYSRLQKTLEINVRGGVTDHNFWLVKMFKFKNAEILISGSIWSLISNVFCSLE
jgi:hypothetical protein